MSAQFGTWNPDGTPVDRDRLKQAKTVIAAYGTHQDGSYIEQDIVIGYCGFHTTKESRCEKQPHKAKSDVVVTWDGRLDNRTVLIRELKGLVDTDSTDVSIVAAAYERWEENCFAMLVGDWAVSIWDPQTRSLRLAKDPVGVRHMYYSLANNSVTWSTILDPRVLLSRLTFTLSEEYIAGWFAHFPALHLTPYVGIHSVPPSSVVLIGNGKMSVHKYWDFDPDKKVRYRNDGEYEEHFRDVFGEAVRRRLRSDRPILAELSGGMDSSSIVCVADKLMAEHKAETTRLDTISYYDDSEPNWNERPYFTRVEVMRGRPGCHIDFRGNERFDFEFDGERFEAIPGCGGKPTEQSRQFAECLATNGNCVVLSGIGGDEVMGGVPTSIPELEDLLATRQFARLAHQLKVWALHNRVPWLRLLFATIRPFLPSSILGVKRNDGPGAWLTYKFVKNNRSALRGLQRRVEFFGPLPSFQWNVSTLGELQRQLTCQVLQRDPLYETRYPYLDRDLLEFMYAVPREQLVRPGRRRSLMRRALRDIVPAEILERRRKAYVHRGPVLALQTARDELQRLLAGVARTVQYGFIDPDNLHRSMISILSGNNTAEWSLLLKTVMLELWLRRNASYLEPMERATEAPKGYAPLNADSAH